MSMAFTPLDEVLDPLVGAQVIQTPYLDLVEDHTAEVVMAAGVILRYAPYLLSGLVEDDEFANLLIAIDYVELTGDTGERFIFDT